jgi:hypothetical protein
MDYQTISAIFKSIFDNYGIVALGMVCLCAMAGVSYAQLLQIKRWAPQTAEIAHLMQENTEALRLIVGKLDAQHTTCTRHYDFAQRQIEGMASIGHELASVVNNLRESDRARTAEIMQLMTIIAGRPRP